MDLIRGIWDVFKNELRHRRHASSSIRRPSKWAAGRWEGGRAGRHGACQAAKYSEQHMNGRPDYFVTNDSLARAHAPRAAADTSGDDTPCCSVSTAASFAQWLHSQLWLSLETFFLFIFFQPKSMLLFLAYSRKPNHNKASSDALTQFNENKKKKKEVQLPICLNRWHVAFPKLSDVQY